MTQYELSGKQSEILQAIWVALDEHGTGPEVDHLNAEYDDTVVELLKLLGEHAPAASIDIGQYEIFSNCFKSDNGIRPRGYTYAAMVSWMDNRRIAA